jgi:uncharacterized pyridoxamine 5'-phosphate oxidase family protein
MLASFFVPSITFFSCTKNEVLVQGNRLEKEDMDIFFRVLQEHPNGVLANRNGNMMRTQIITSRFAEDDRVYFFTSNSKPVYKQLRRYPYVSYCTFAEEFEPVVSINGKVVFVEDPALKSRLFELSHIKSAKHRPDDPDSAFFYIDIEEIETYGSDGAKIYKIK